MGKRLLIAGFGVFAGVSAQATDPLDNSIWKIVDETGRSEALVAIHQEGNHFVGRLHKSLINRTTCDDCAGKFANKPMLNIAIIYGLKADGNGKYVDGYIVDPKKDKTYRLQAELINNNQALKLRGYLGFSLLGRTQTWVRVQ